MDRTWNAKPFEALTLHELHDLLRLRVDIFVVEQACAYPEIDGQDPESIHVMARNADGALIAYARVLPPEGGGLPHIGRVVVRASERGKGLAHGLMEHALEVLKNTYGTRRSELAAQAHLESFYTQFGYVRQGADYPWDGIPHVDMRREAD